MSRPRLDSRDGALVFPRTGQPQGFATLATTQWDGNPEPVVRELVQNSLDACVRAERARCEVSFTIREVALNDLPGIDDYRSHFHEARRERGKNPQGLAEKEIIARIEKVLKRDRILVLLCRDNGTGLNAQTMSRLLTEGNTDKTDVGAGAFGVGHLTAFAASDTRYVLYAGRSCGPGGSGGSNGACLDVASAHAILASRVEKDLMGAVRGFGAHGFWLARGGTGPGGEQLGLFDPKYPDLVPDPLRAQLEKLPESGAVVCVTGFNRFRSDQDPVDAIAHVSAKNFLVAIQQRRMVIRVRDETTRPVHQHTVDSTLLRELLEKQKDQKRTKSGWLPGEQAFRCVRTLEEGERISLRCGAMAQIRFLNPSAGGTSRSSHVQLFRNGMWITNRADQLTPPFFAGFNPFDAAIMIEGGEIGTLIRGAEGPEHRGLDRRRLGSGRSRQRLLHLLREIRNELQHHAGKVRQTTEYTPDDFAVFGRRGARRAEKVAPHVPRQVPADDTDDTDVTTPAASGDSDAGSIDPQPGKRGGEPGGGAKPKPGKAVPGRSSVLAVRNGNGEIDTLRVYWKPEGNRAGKPATLGVRVRIPSGSDETCELPLGPTWLRLKQLRLQGHAPARPTADGFEAAFPDGEIEFELALAAPINDANAVEVDFVRRTNPRAASG